MSSTVATTPTCGSVLVNLADEADLTLVRLLVDESTDLFTACTACLEKENEYAGELAELLLKDSKVIERVRELVNQDNDSDAVGAVSLLAGLLQRSAEADDTNNSKTSNSPPLVLALLDAIVGNTTDKDDLATTEKKMQLLTVLYNILPAEADSTSKEPSLQCTLLMRLFQVAATHKDTILQPETALGRWIFVPNKSTTAAPPLTKLLQSWSSADRCRVYETVATILNDHDDKEKQRFLLLVLTENPDAANTNIAKQVVIGAIQDPVTLFRRNNNANQNLLQQTSNIPAIHTHLRKAEPALVELLEIVRTGQLADYQAFAKKNSNAFASWGLDATACEKNMRVLSLCSLAASSSTVKSNAIPYSTIRDTLQDDDVEKWVVEAVNSGLLQAKLDQLSETVLVQGCVVRKFDMEQWKQLQTRLKVWKQNVGNVLAALDQANKESQPTGQ